MASWIEVSIPARGDPESVCSRLTELGIEGFVVEDESDFRAFLENNTQYWDFVDEGLEQQFAGRSRVRFWLPEDDASAALVARLQKLGMEPETHIVADEDWADNWREHYKPIEIGEKLVILPQWETVPESRLPVVLDPGLLFGTGDHETTRLCLEAAERYAAPGKRALDIGCGSGILGIAAALLGCETVTAADVDEKAPEVVKANAALNGVEERFSVFVGDVTASESLRRRLGSGYELVFSNIVADVIIALAPHYRHFLAPQGVAVVSGIIEGRQQDVEAALTAAGLRVLEHNVLHEWHCFVVQ